jgi:Flp pilus assembly protein TadG
METRIKYAAAREEQMNTGRSLRERALLLARRMKRGLRFRGEQGGALVEFAVTIPLMMTVLTGTASFSMALYFLQQLGNATSTAAMLVGAEQGLTSDPCATAVTSITDSLPNWKAGSLTYTLVITDSSGTTHSYGPTAGSSFSCTAGAAEMAPNEPVTLTVSFAYSWLPIYKYSPSSALTSSDTAMAE